MPGACQTGPKEELLLRQGRASGWIEEALAPLRDRLTRQGLHRLVLAVRSACGIEALVWLTDVARLSRLEAAEINALVGFGALALAAQRRRRAPRAELTGGGSVAATGRLRH
jgi:hypothetical protein